MGTQNKTLFQHTSESQTGLGANYTEAAQGGMSGSGAAGSARGPVVQPRPWMNVGSATKHPGELL